MTRRKTAAAETDTTGNETLPELRERRARLNRMAETNRAERDELLGKMRANDEAVFDAEVRLAAGALGMEVAAFKVWAREATLKLEQREREKQREQNGEKRA